MNESENLGNNIPPPSTKRVKKDLTFQSLPYHVTRSILNDYFLTMVEFGETKLNITSVESNTKERGEDGPMQMVLRKKVDVELNIVNMREFYGRFKHDRTRSIFVIFASVKMFSQKTISASDSIGKFFFGRSFAKRVESWVWFQSIELPVSHLYCLYMRFDTDLMKPKLPLEFMKKAENLRSLGSFYVMMEDERRIRHEEITKSLIRSGRIHIGEGIEIERFRDKKEEKEDEKTRKEKEDKLLEELMAKKSKKYFSCSDFDIFAKYRIKKLLFSSPDINDKLLKSIQSMKTLKSLRMYYDGKKRDDLKEDFKHDALEKLLVRGAYFTAFGYSRIHGPMPITFSLLPKLKKLTMVNYPIEGKILNGILKSKVLEKLGIIWVFLQQELVDGVFSLVDNHSIKKVRVHGSGCEVPFFEALVQSLKVLEYLKVQECSPETAEYLNGLVNSGTCNTLKKVKVERVQENDGDDDDEGNALGSEMCMVN